RSLNHDQKSTYNTRYSLVVTDPTTNPALIRLSMGERTGSRVFRWVWSYVLDRTHCDIQEGHVELQRNSSHQTCNSFPKFPHFAHLVPRAYAYSPYTKLRASLKTVNLS
ncbi:hypothetical protein BDP55DRAFT_564924, partial [Colletotrichum godetiae]